MSLNRRAMHDPSQPSASPWRSGLFALVTLTLLLALMGCGSDEVEDRVPTSTGVTPQAAQPGTNPGEREAPADASSPTPAPTATETPSPTPSPTATVAVQPTPTAAPASTPTPTPAPTLAPTSAPSVAPSPTPGRASVPTAVPTRVPLPTPAPTATPTPMATPAPTPTPTPTPTATPRPTPTPATAAENPGGEAVDVALAPLGDSLLWVASFNNSTKGWSLYDPSGSFEPESLGIPPESASSIGALTHLQPGTVYYFNLNRDVSLYGFIPLGRGITTLLWPSVSLQAVAPTPTPIIQATPTPTPAPRVTPTPTPVQATPTPGPSRYGGASVNTGAPAV